MPLGNLTCEKTCTGASCAVTCPIDEQLACPSGGSATDRGRSRASSTRSLTGDAALAAAQGFSGCKPNAGLTIDGAPATTATGTARFANGQLADEQTVRIAGAVRYAIDDRGLRHVRRRPPGDLQPRAPRLGLGTACGELASSRVASRPALPVPGRPVYASAA